MAEETVDLWAGEDALSPEADWIIKDAKFGHDERLGENLVLKLTVDVVVDGLTVSRDREQLLGCGKDWTTSGDGRRAEHPDTAKERTFNKQTSYYKFMEGAVKVEGKEAFKGKDPRDASIWIGKAYHIERKAFGKKMNSDEPRMVQVPTALAEGSATVAGSVELDDNLKSQLTELAKQYEDHDEFMMHALNDVEGVNGNAEAEKVIGDSSEAGLWATARA